MRRCASFCGRPWVAGVRWRARLSGVVRGGRTTQGWRPTPSRILASEAARPSLQRAKATGLRPSVKAGGRNPSEGRGLGAMRRGLAGRATGRRSSGVLRLDRPGGRGTVSGSAAGCVTPPSPSATPRSAGLGPAAPSDRLDGPDANPIPLRDRAVSDHRRFQVGRLGPARGAGPWDTGTTRSGAAMA